MRSRYDCGLNTVLHNRRSGLSNLDVFTSQGLPFR